MGPCIRMNTTTPDGPGSRLRIARPVTDLPSAAARYAAGLGLVELGRFAGHAGFDGVILGTPGGPWHLELTHRPAHPVAPAPTPEDLLVLYLPDPAQFTARCDALEAAGFGPVTSLNPYWDEHGRTFEDADGYRVVVCRRDWTT